MIKEDSQSFIALARNFFLHIYTKHINIQHYYICNEIISGKINLAYIPTEEMLVDRVTKSLLYVKLLNFI